MALGLRKLRAGRKGTRGSDRRGGQCGVRRPLHSRADRDPRRRSTRRLPPAVPRRCLTFRCSTPTSPSGSARGSARRRWRPRSRTGAAGWRTCPGSRYPPIAPARLGFFANPVPLRADLRRDPTLRELLARVRDDTLEALAHDDVPFEVLVDALGVERDPGRNPLFQVAFSLEAPRAAWPAGWDAGHLDVDTGTSKFDLYLELDERPDAIVGRIVYRTDLFDPTTIERMSDRYARVLESVLRPGAHPGRRGRRRPGRRRDAEPRDVRAVLHRGHGLRPLALRRPASRLLTERGNAAAARRPDTRLGPAGPARGGPHHPRRSPHDRDA